jgi:HK97 family phage portal protein
MGFIGRMIAESRASSVPGLPPRDPVLAAWMGGGSNTSSGVSVTADSAPKAPAVYACGRVLAETLGAMPLHVQKKTKSGKERAVDHPLYAVLHDQPNRWQTSIEWRETHVWHTAMRGISYSEIALDGAGRVASLNPLHPDRMAPLFGANGQVSWRYIEQTGATRYLLDDEVLKLPGLACEVYRPLSPIGLHRETIGLTMGRREYQARFFGNSAVPKGGIKFPNPLSPEASKQVRASWNERHRGAENANQIAIFDGGMEWVEIGMSHEDAQFVELEGLSVLDIARIFRVPPHKIADLSRATFSNIEHQSIEFVTDTILPWAVRWKQRLDLALLSAADRAAGYEIEFDLKGLLRGDAAARANFYRALFYLGALTPNDIRRLEDMDELAAPEASMTFVQNNMVPLEMLKDVIAKMGAGAQQSQPGTIDTTDPNTDQALRSMIRSIFTEEGYGRQVN